MAVDISYLGINRCVYVSQGEKLWCSPVQNPLTGIIADEKKEVIITSDSTGLIKSWQGQTGQELASFSTESSHCKLLQFNINNDWFLIVSSPKTS